MRGIWIGVMALVATACASGGPAPERAVAEALQVEGSPSELITNLPAQSLAPGQCGVFLFETRQPNHFVVFEDEANRLVRLVHAGAVYEAAVTPQPGGFLPGDTFVRRYAMEGGRVFTLEGRVGQDTPSGQRLVEVILTTVEPDGARIVRPVGGVRRCRDG
jgi:hypothetical protein